MGSEPADAISQRLRQLIDPLRPEAVSLESAPLLTSSAERSPGVVGFRQFLLDFPSQPSIGRRAAAVEPQQAPRLA